MKVWVIAKSGMLGASIYRLLKNKKIELIATSRKDVDITKKEQIFQFAKDNRVTHIINCAAYTQVDLAEEQSLLAYESNALGVQNIAQVAAQMSIHVTHFSTDYVFSGNTHHPYQELDLTQSLNVYGKTKRQGEEFLLNSLTESCIIRTSWLFGYDGKNFVKNMLSYMQTKKKLQIVADQIGSPTFCEDLAVAVWNTIDQRGILHFSNQGSVSWFSFAKEILSLAKLYNFPVICEKLEPIDSSQYPAKANRPLHSVLSTEKYEKLFASPRSWKEALEEFIQELSINEL